MDGERAGRDVPREEPSKKMALSSHLCSLPMRPTSPAAMTACNNAYRPREPLRSKNMKVESRSVVPSSVLAHSGAESGGEKNSP